MQGPRDDGAVYWYIYVHTSAAAAVLPAYVCWTIATFFFFFFNFVVVVVRSSTT